MAIDEARNRLLVILLAELVIETALLEKLSGKKFTLKDVV